MHLGIEDSIGEAVEVKKLLASDEYAAPVVRLGARLELSGYCILYTVYSIALI